MLVFCEECGKRYSFPPEKVDPGSGQFRCRECNFLMKVNSPSVPEDVPENQGGQKKLSKDVEQKTS